MTDELLKTIFSFLGVGGVVLTLAFAGFRGLMSLRGEATSQTPQEIHNAQLETFRLIAHEANTRADTFAIERNELVVKVTRVEGQLTRLNDVVDQNDRLRSIVDQKDAAIRLMVSNFTDTQQQLLRMMEGKDETLLAQARSIATLEEGMRSLREQLSRTIPAVTNGTVTTTVTTAS